MLALASPASLKGVLSPLEAAAFLAAGMRRVDGVEVDEAPVADGGEGTADVIHAALGGEWRTAVVSDALGSHHRYADEPIKRAMRTGGWFS